MSQENGNFSIICESNTTGNGCGVNRLEPLSGSDVAATGSGVQGCIFPPHDKVSGSVPCWTLSRAIYHEGCLSSPGPLSLAQRRLLDGGGLGKRLPSTIALHYGAPVRATPPPALPGPGPRNRPTDNARNTNRTDNQCQTTVHDISDPNMSLGTQKANNFQDQISIGGQKALLSGPPAILSRSDIPTENRVIFVVAHAQAPPAPSPAH
ncbi:hypothetical protein Bbelb_066800 [Branchiostoma belcheri]|nr:hypothetical protein Bbelb_066800 [Branchiostoma belcheri]